MDNKPEPTSNAFLNPSRAGSRLQRRVASPSSVSSDNSSVSSRRSKSLKTGEREKFIFDNLNTANTVSIKQRNKVRPTSPMDQQTGTFFQSFFGSQAPTPGDVAKRSQIEKTDTKETDHSDTPTSGGRRMEVHVHGRGGTPYSELSDEGTTNTKSTNRSHLDFEHNDNAFHILGNLLVEIFEKNLSEDKTTVLVDHSIREKVERVLPKSARESFITAIRKRAVRSPKASTSSVDQLVNKCKELGFNLDGPQNPISVSVSGTKLPKAVRVVSKANTMDFPVADEGDTVATAKTHRTMSTYDLAKEQLTAEIRQAERLMDESVTPETKKFWNDHIAGLQNRLRALEGVAPADRENMSLAPQSVVGQRFRSQAQYNPPKLESNRSGQKVLVPTDSRVAVADLPTVDVVAPADLPGGYHFEAEIRGKRFLATVPEGGVKEGETFTSVMRDLSSFQIDIPIGYWKDSSTDCFRHGFFHPALCNAIFCPALALAQVTERINLDFLGRPRVSRGDHLSNRAMMNSVTAFWAILNLGVFGLYNLKWFQGMELSFADVGALALVNAAMYGFIVFVAQSTRGSIRERFLIREEGCKDLEDVVVSSFCLPCTVSQMARHTANFDEYPAACCTENGLDEEAPPVSLSPRHKADNYIV